jgi:hypothetical protein
MGNYIGAPVVYITHSTRENIIMSKNKIHSLVKEKQDGFPKLIS